MIDKPVCPVCGGIVKENENIKDDMYVMGKGIVSRPAFYSFEFSANRMYKLWEREVFTCSGCKKDFIGFFIDDNEIGKKINMIDINDLEGVVFNG